MSINSPEIMLEAMCSNKKSIKQPLATFLFWSKAGVFGAVTHPGLLGSHAWGFTLTRDISLMVETSAAFSHLCVDPAVMELPAVFLSQVDWVCSSQALHWCHSSLHHCGAPRMLFSIEPHLHVSWVHVMPLAALFSWELRIMEEHLLVRKEAGST